MAAVNIVGIALEFILWGAMGVIGELAAIAFHSNNIKKDAIATLNKYNRTLKVNITTAGDRLY